MCLVYSLEKYENRNSFNGAKSELSMLTHMMKPATKVIRSHLFSENKMTFVKMQIANGEEDYCYCFPHLFSVQTYFEQDLITIHCLVDFLSSLCSVDYLYLVLLFDRLRCFVVEV